VIFASYAAAPVSIDDPSSFDATGRPLSFEAAKWLAAINTSVVVRRATAPDGSGDVIYTFNVPDMTQVMDGVWQDVSFRVPRAQADVVLPDPTDGDLARNYGWTPNGPPDYTTGHQRFISPDGTRELNLYDRLATIPSPRSPGEAEAAGWHLYSWDHQNGQKTYAPPFIPAGAQGGALHGLITFPVTPDPGNHYSLEYGPLWGGGGVTRYVPPPPTPVIISAPPTIQAPPVPVTAPPTSQITGGPAKYLKPTAPAAGISPVVIIGGVAVLALLLRRRV
jgi:hypothetical protein